MTSLFKQSIKQSSSKYKTGSEYSSSFDSDTFDSSEESSVYEDDSSLTDIAKIQRRQIAENPPFLPCVCFYIGPDNRTLTTPQSTTEDYQTNNEMQFESKNMDQKEGCDRDMDNASSVAVVKSMRDFVNNSAWTTSCSNQPSIAQPIASSSFHNESQKSPDTYTQVQEQSYSSPGPSNIQNAPLQVTTSTCPQNITWKPTNTEKDVFALKIMSTNQYVPSTFLNIGFGLSMPPLNISENDGSQYREPIPTYEPMEEPVTAETTVPEYDETITPLPWELESAIESVLAEPTPNNDASPQEQYTVSNWIAFSEENAQRLEKARPQHVNKASIQSNGESSHSSHKEETEKIQTSTVWNEAFKADIFGWGSRDLEDGWNNDCYNYYWRHEEYDSGKEDLNAPENAKYELETDEEPSFWERFCGESDEDEQEVDDGPRVPLEDVNGDFWGYNMEESNADAMNGSVYSIDQVISVSRSPTHDNDGPFMIDFLKEHRTIQVRTSGPSDDRLLPGFLDSMPNIFHHLKPTACSPDGDTDSAFMYPNGTGSSYHYNRDW